MDSDHAEKALKDGKLFYHIAEHRSTFSPLRGIDYSNYIPSSINIVPPGSVIEDYANDYNVMKESMFTGESLSWDDILKRLIALQEKIRALVW